MSTKIHPRFIPDPNGPTAADWARLAAYIDSEGCIAISKMVNKSRYGTGRMWTNYQVMVQLVNTDPRLNVWLGRFDVNASYKTRPNSSSKFSNALPLHTWIVRGWSAHYILTNCLPYFVLKLDQAELALSFQDSKRSYGRGHPVPADVKEDWNKTYGRIRELKNPPTAWERIIQ